MLGLAAAMVGAHVAIQLLVVDMGRWLAWDEAVYVSMATPETEPIGWAATRSLGMPAILWIPVRAGVDMVPTRAWLIFLGAVLTLVALVGWSRVLGLAGLLWFPIVGLTSLGVWFPSEAYPNWLAAVSLVGAVGWSFVAQRPWFVPAGLAAVASVVRPGDALIVALAAIAWSWLRRGRRGAGVAFPLLFGAGVGWVIWLVESFVSFGGPIARIEDANRIVNDTTPVSKYLTDLAQVPVGSSLTTGGARVAWLWVGLMVAAAVLGLRRPPPRGRTPVEAAAAASVALSLLYLWRPDQAWSRFLIPSIALLAVAAGAGAAALWQLVRRHPSWAAPVGLAVCAAFALTTVWHVDRASHRNDRATARATILEVGVSVEAIAAGRECVIHTQAAAPQLALASGCEARTLRFDQEGVEPPRVEQGGAEFLVGPRPPTGAVAGAGWMPVEEVGAWKIYGLDVS